MLVNFDRDAMHCGVAVGCPVVSSKLRTAASAAVQVCKDADWFVHVSSDEFDSDIHSHTLKTLQIHFRVLGE